VLVTGISGSGKSVRCMRSRTPASSASTTCRRVAARLFCCWSTPQRSPCAIAVDVRSAGSLPHLLPALAQLRSEGIRSRRVPRREHRRAGAPLLRDAPAASAVRSDPFQLSARHDGDCSDGRALIDAIELERQLLAELREVSTVIDTSQLRPRSCAPGCAISSAPTTAG
jgi:UPF0042 nucleotide-binding protein